MARTRPHTKIHISVAHHPKTQDVWADPMQRGMLVEVWRLGMERFAGKRGDILSLRPLDRLSITASSTLVEADFHLSSLFKALKYKVRKHPNRWDVHIRNYATKHGFEGKERDTDKPKNGTHNKEQRTENKEQRTKNTQGAEDSPASQARSAWPDLRAIAQGHGKTWMAKPTTNQITTIAARIADGASLADLSSAVEGYVRRLGLEPFSNGYDPLKNFTAAQVFSAKGFGPNVEASTLEPRASPEPPESAAAARQRRTHDAAQEAMRRFQERKQTDGLKTIEGGRS